MPPRRSDLGRHGRLPSRRPPPLSPAAPSLAAARGRRRAKPVQGRRRRGVSSRRQLRTSSHGGWMRRGGWLLVWRGGAVLRGGGAGVDVCEDAGGGGPGRVRSGLEMGYAGHAAARSGAAGCWLVAGFWLVRLRLDGVCSSCGRRRWRCHGGVPACDGGCGGGGRQQGYLAGLAAPRTSRTDRASGRKPCSDFVGANDGGASGCRFLLDCVVRGVSSPPDGSGANSSG